MADGCHPTLLLPGASGMNDPLHEEQLTSELVLSRPPAERLCDEVRPPDGKSGVREYIASGRGVGDSGGVTTVGWIRAAVPLSAALAFLELPAGKLDPDEDILGRGAARTAGGNRLRGRRLASSGRDAPVHRLPDERIEIFLASGLATWATPGMRGVSEIVYLTLDEAGRGVRRPHHRRQDDHRAVLGRAGFGQGPIRCGGCF